MILKNSQPLTIRVQAINLVAGKPELIKKMRALTLMPGSGMNYELTHLLSKAKYRQVDAQVILGYSNRVLVAWALCSREESDFVFPNGLVPFQKGLGVLFEIFVHKDYRRQGIGSEMIKIARHRASGTRLCVCPWDCQSRHFYKKFENFKYKKL